MTAIAKQQFAGITRNGPITISVIVLGAGVFACAVVAFGLGYELLAARGLPAALVIHLATVIPAIPLGAYVFLRRKGDRVHRMLGRVWAIMMVVTALASFGIGDDWSPIHILSVTTLGAIALSIWRIRNGNVKGHRRAMEAVFIGLVIAGAFTFIPGRLLGSMLFG